MRRSLAAALVALTSLVGAIALPQPASAHGDDETQEGYLLVQQALGHLAHDTGSEGVDLAMEKVKDALETEDQEGVDVPEVEQGMRALDAGRVDQARTLLQDSISEALAEQPRATGNQSGTTVVLSELPGRSGLSGLDWALLGASIALAGVGLVLSYRFRPRDSVAELRRRLQPDATTAADAETPQVEGEP
jgi:hypothetical protein